jgi:glycine/D-amino acid oxidase-like deaminating enzyme
MANETGSDTRFVVKCGVHTASSSTAIARQVTLANRGDALRLADHLRALGLQSVAVFRRAPKVDLDEIGKCEQCLRSLREGDSYVVDTEDGVYLCGACDTQKLVEVPS